MKSVSSIITQDYKSLGVGIFLGILSGLVSFSFLTFFNLMINMILLDNYQQVDSSYIIVFVFIIICFIWSRRSLSFYIIKFSQKLFWRLRIDVLKIILKSNYEQLESQRNLIHSALVNDIGTLTQASLSIISFVTSTIVSLACLVYMMNLNMNLFFLTLGTCVLGILIYQIGARKNTRRFDESRGLEDEFMHSFRAILSGVKEIHINPFKGHDILDKKIRPLSNNAYRINTNAFVGFLNNQITGQILFYSLIASILLGFSVLLQVEKSIVVNYLFILLYLLGAVETVMVLLPGLSRGKVAINRLNALKENLEQNEFSNELPTSILKKDEFVSMRTNDLGFHYENENQENAFSIGPINFELKKGDITFVYGGNGSGKTTFVYSLLGLLKSHSGTISFNGRTLDKDNYGEYKTLFSGVLNNFHMFDEFYGMNGYDKEKALEYIELFELTGKVELVDTGFTTTNLSTGQRKRLALISAILENRPIIVLDEWAADQDPYFRKKFYTEILTKMKEDGFTVLAITHDDKYYENCDKLYQMDYGKLKEVVSHQAIN